MTSSTQAEAEPASLEALITPKMRERLGDAFPLRDEAGVWRKIQPLLERRDWKHGGSILRFFSFAFKTSAFSGHVPVMLPGGSSWRLVLDDILESLAGTVTGEVPREVVPTIFEFLNIVRDRLSGDGLTAAVRVGFSLLPVASAAEDFLVQLATECTERMVEEPTRGDGRVEWLATILARKAVNEATNVLDPTNSPIVCVVCGMRAGSGAAEDRWSTCSGGCSELNDRNLNGGGMSSLGDFVSLFRTLCKVVSKAGSLNGVKRTAFKLLDVLLRQSGSHASLALHIKTELCPALLNLENLHEVAIGMFVFVVNLNSSLLTMELGMWLEQVFLPVLEAAAGGLMEEELVEAFGGVFGGGRSAETVLNVFVAFDCSMNRGNLYERSILCLTKVARTKPSLRFPVIECLRGLLETLKDHVIALVAANPGDLPSMGFPEQRPLSVERSVSAGRGRDGGSGVGVAGGQSLMDARLRKQQLEEAMAVFNEKPTRGVQKLVSLGFIEGGNVAQIAEFLLSHGSLDKKAIGDYLGENNATSKGVLAEFAGKFNFVQDSLVDAMRKFLESFRLPGEGQKIDRVLEQFASKYYRDNPEVFGSADVAYILSFSVIMLNTDLHSEKVKKKMTVEEFIKNNRGINGPTAAGGGDVSPELLQYLYNQIKQQPIKLKSEDGHGDGGRVRRSTNASSSSGDEDVVNFETSEALIPITSVTAFPVLSAFSQAFDEFPEAAIAGLAAGVRVCARLGLGLERDAFISSLAGFTGLLQTPMGTTARTVTSKKALAIRTLLRLAADEEADHFEEVAWKAVLTVVSEVARMLTNSSLKGKKPQPSARVLISNVLLRLKALPLDLLAAFEGLGLVVNPDPPALVSMGVPSPPAEMELEEEVPGGRLGVELDEVDRVFGMSTRLSGETIVKFVQELCAAAEKELAQKNQTFLLVKLVEVAAFNMDRMRVVWTRLWRHVASAFGVALSPKLTPSTAVQLLAVDALKQLTLKFLMTRDEADHFRFQEELLRPLESGFIEGNVEVKEMIMSVMNTFVTVKEVRLGIKSGWLVIFRILKTAAECEFLSVYKTALLISTHLVYLKDSKVDTADNHKFLVLAVLLELCRKQFKYGNHDLPVALRVLGDFVDKIPVSDHKFHVFIFRQVVDNLLVTQDFFAEARNAGLAFLLDLFKDKVLSTDASLSEELTHILLDLVRKLSLQSQTPNGSEATTLLLQTTAQRLVRMFAVSPTPDRVCVSELGEMVKLAIVGWTTTPSVFSVFSDLCHIFVRVDELSALYDLFGDLLARTQSSSAEVHTRLLGELRSFLLSRPEDDRRLEGRLLETVRESYELARRTHRDNHLVKAEKQAAMLLLLFEEDRDEVDGGLARVVKQVVCDFKEDKDKRKAQLGAALAEGLLTRWSVELKKTRPKKWTLGVLGDLILCDDLAVREKVKTVLDEALTPRLITE